MSPHRYSPLANYIAYLFNTFGEDELWMKGLFIDTPGGFSDVNTTQSDIELAWWADDTHLNAGGNSDVAEFIYKTFFHPIFRVKENENPIVDWK